MRERFGKFAYDAMCRSFRNSSIRELKGDSQCFDGLSKSCVKFVKCRRTGWGDSCPCQIKFLAPLRIQGQDGSRALTCGGASGRPPFLFQRFSIWDHEPWKFETRLSDPRRRDAELVFTLTTILNWRDYTQASTELCAVLQREYEMGSISFDVGATIGRPLARCWANTSCKHAIFVAGRIATPSRAVSTRTNTHRQLCVDTHRILNDNDTRCICIAVPGRSHQLPEQTSRFDPQLGRR